MDLDTRYLHTFFAVCEHGGFGPAAEKLHRTQPAISYQVKMLEQQMDARLFERPGRNLVLTPAGKRLREFCARSFAEFETIQSEFAENRPARMEPLRIASVSGFGRYVLFPLLCQRGFAHLRLNLTFKTAADVFKEIESGQWDLGAVYQTKVSNYLHFRLAHVEELVLIASPAFRIPRGSLRRLEVYESLPFVTYEEADYVFGKWFQTFFNAPPAVTSSVHHFEELEEVVEMVALNRGLSVVPKDAVAEAVRRKQIRILRPLKKRCLNEVFLVTRAGAFLRPEMRLIMDTLRRRRGARSRIFEV
jgi:DNA-binding transcriptional LysR family regulator